jgi:hypothetical protein
MGGWKYTAFDDDNPHKTRTRSHFSPPNPPCPLTSHAYVLLERVERFIDRRPPGRKEVMKRSPVGRDLNSTGVHSKPIAAWVVGEKGREH